MKYTIELWVIGVWWPIDAAETFEDALAIASMQANRHGEDRIQITGGVGINQP